MTNEECLPITTLPGTTALYRDYTEPAGAADRALIGRWYPTRPFGLVWAGSTPELSVEHRERLAGLLREQAVGFGAENAALANIEALRAGAAAVVTGQQVGIFGGPLLTLLKAATAVRQAQLATEKTGRRHVPVFWLASEDHDLAEVDQATFIAKTGPETVTLGLKSAQPVPVGTLTINDAADAVLEQVGTLLNWAPVVEELRAAYAPGTTLAAAMGKLLTRIFAAQGLVVMDAATREFHALGRTTLRAAIEQVDALEAALLSRSHELTAAGYHAQVLITPSHSLLFLVDAESGARVPLRRTAEQEWKAGGRVYSTPELLEILEATPERISPNALLRPVFQDTILPTAAYVGGPAEIAYFAQSAVVYEAVLGRVTPVLPRLSATLIGPETAALMAQHEVTLETLFADKTAEALALRLGARAMPVEGKRKIAAAGNALDAELTALTEYLSTMSADLGRAAGVSASKMRYQMNRLRRMAARYETERQTALTKQAAAMMFALYPGGHLQERVTAGVAFLARFGEGLIETLVEHAGLECPGHRVIRL